MSAIDNWRAATALREQIKTVKDFAQVNGNEVLISVSSIQTKVPGGAPTAVAEAVRAYVAQVIQSELRTVINLALNSARDDIVDKAILARAEAEEVIRDAT